MKIKIRMVSGRIIKLENYRANNILDFITNQFKSDYDFIWYIPNEDRNMALNFNNIESIEEYK